MSGEWQVESGERTRRLARLIVCERTGRWATLLRRELSDSGVRVFETRTLDDCWNALDESPASMIVVELGGDPAGLLDRMARLPREFPRARLAVAADRRWAGYRRLMHEAGAVWFVDSPRRVGPLARLALRHLAAAPTAPQTLVERIWENLPFSTNPARNLQP